MNPWKLYYYTVGVLAGVVTGSSLTFVFLGDGPAHIWLSVACINGFISSCCWTAMNSEKLSSD